MTVSRSRLGKMLAVVAAFGAATAAVPGIFPGTASATTPAAPPWETSTNDPGALGTLGFYNAAGGVVTSGDLYDPSTLTSGSPSPIPLFSYVVASGAPSGYTGTKATLYFAMPDHTKNVGLWGTHEDSAGGTNFPVTSAPSPLTGPAFALPVDGPLTVDNDGADLPGALGSLPAPDTTAGYANVIQVRMPVTASGHLGLSTYWVGDLAYNTDTNLADSPITVDGVAVPPNTWEDIYPGPASSVTTTTVHPSVNPTGVGQQVTYTAAVSPAPITGSVQFLDGGVPITGCASRLVTSGNASCSVAYSSVGSHTVSAIYSGDPWSLTSSTTLSVNETVAATATTTTVSAPNDEADDQPVTYTATVSPVPDGGTVAFTDNGTAIAACASQVASTTTGVATCTVPAYGAAGIHSIVASYSDDLPSGTGNFADSTSATWTETIQGASTATSVIGAPNPVDAGQPVTYTATVSPVPDGGTVAFSDGGSVISGCSSDNVSTSTGMATCTATPSTGGVHLITAAYTDGAPSGTGNFADSTSSAYTEHVATSTATVITPSVPAAVVGQTVTYVAMVSPIPDGGTVAFGGIAGCPSVAVSTTTGEASCQITPSVIGTEMVSAAYGGDTLYGSSMTSSTTNVTIGKAATSVALGTSQTSAFAGSTVSFTAQITVAAPGGGTPTGTVTFSATNGASQTVSLASGTASTSLGFPSPGTFAVTATYNGDGSYTGSMSSGVTETISAPTAPSAPIGLTVVLGNGEAELSWNPPMSDGGSPITGYNVYVSTGTESTTSVAGRLADAIFSPTTPVNPTPITGTSYTVTGLTNGVNYSFTVVAINSIGSSTPSNPIKGTPSQSSGYTLAGSDGGVFVFGSTNYHGSLGGKKLAAPIVGIAETKDSGGYWLAGADGGVFSFGDAVFHGTVSNTKLAAPVSGIAAAPGGGYWLVGADGGVFAFNAPFYGSLGGKKLSAPIVAIVATSDGGGYWLIGSDGGVFSFGDAVFHGSLGGKKLLASVVGGAAAPNGGYWLVAGDGGVFTFGGAGFYGSMGGKKLNGPAVAIEPTADGAGYTVIGNDGGAFDFGNAVYCGSLPGEGVSVDDVIGAV